MKSKHIRFKRILAGLTFLMMFAAFTSVTAWAQAPQVRTQVPGYYRTMIGQFEITALFDGAIELETKLLHNTSEQELASLLSRMFVGNPKMQTAVNGYLINTSEHLVLVDAGAGSLFGPSLGNIVKNLQAAGYSPEQVDTVVITHLHGDHMGGLINENGKPYFPKAMVFVSKPDNDFWLSEETAAEAPEEVQPFFKMARDTAAPLQENGQWQTFSEGSEIVPGITAVKANGHTPGHTAFEVASDEHKMLIWGDIVHAHAVQFTNPGVSIEFDIDQPRAIATRKAIMEETSATGILVAGMHLPFPGIGHVRKDSEGSYAWVPVEYSPLPNSDQ